MEGVRGDPHTRALRPRQPKGYDAHGYAVALYSYDRSEEEELTLRDSADEVAAALERELYARLQKAGVADDEARLTHLAYAPDSRKRCFGGSKRKP